MIRIELKQTKDNECHCISALAKARCGHYRSYECCKAEDLKDLVKK